MISSPATSAWQLYDLNMPGIHGHYYVLASTLNRALALGVDDTITVGSNELMVVSNVTETWLRKEPDRTMQLIEGEREGRVDYDDEDGWVFLAH